MFTDDEGKYMIIADPGHRYLLHALDKVNPEIYVDLVFVKRIGEKFPGNIAPGYTGTNIQEVLRACIDRLKYLDGQEKCEENRLVTQNLQDSIYLLEQRAARKHGRVLRVGSHVGIEHFPFCPKCGHIGHKCAA